MVSNNIHQVLTLTWELSGDKGVASDRILYSLKWFPSVVTEYLSS